MPLNKYRVFYKIAETGNMRRAAKEMMYTQQAVSRIVKCLEDEYQFPLFVRERDGVKLTPEAERMLPAVKLILQEEDKLQKIITDIQAEQGLTKQIQIGACGSIVMQSVYSTLEVLARENPDISVGIHYNADDATTIKEMKSGKLECAIMVEGCQGDLDFEPVFKEEIFAVVPRNHVIANKEEVSIEELMHYPNVITRDNPKYDELMANAEHHTIVVDEELLMMPLIHKNGAVGIMSGIHQFDNNYDLAVVPLIEDHYRVLGIATRPNDESNELTKLFIETFKAVHKQ